MPDRDDKSDSPKLQAAALGYQRGSDTAPRLMARGQGEVAERILESAQAHGIPIERDPDLLQCLGSLQVGEDIPVEAYRAVAQVLAFLYQQNSA